VSPPSTVCILHRLDPGNRSARTASMVCTKPLSITRAQSASGDCTVQPFLQFVNVVCGVIRMSPADICQCKLPKSKPRSFCVSNGQGRAAGERCAFEMMWPRTGALPGRIAIRDCLSAGRACLLTGSYLYSIHRRVAAGFMILT
jgi:hypothetical protein